MDRQEGRWFYWGKWITGMNVSSDPARQKGTKADVDRAGTLGPITLLDTPHIYMAAEVYTEGDVIRMWYHESLKEK
jgi:hypothetical protein